MKIIDIVVYVLFVAGLVVLCFFQNCPMDILFLVLGFGVAAMCGATMIWQAKSKKKKDTISDK